MASVRVKTGTEGPRHDPYGWTEVRFTTTAGQTITYRHGGLGYSRTTWDDEVIETVDHNKSTQTETADEAFERLTGMKPQDAEMIPYELELRMLRRMSREDREQYFAFIEADEKLMSYAM